MPNYRPYLTDDGSIGLFSGDVDDIFHSRYGALTEAYEKFILPSNLEYHLKNNFELNILDICYGIGYNTKALINEIINYFETNKYNIASIDSNNTRGEKYKGCIESICSDKNSPNKNNTFSLKKLYDKNLSKNFLNDFNSNQSKNNNLSSFDVSNIAIREERIDSKSYNINIDALEYEEEFVFLSPFIKNISFNNKYKLRKEVNQFIYNSLLEQYDENYLSKINSYTILKKAKKFFTPKSSFIHENTCKKGDKYTLIRPLKRVLHNIYYQNVSNQSIDRNNKVGLNNYQNLSKRLLGKIFDNNFNLSLNFYIDDARISLKKLDKKYNIVFLDAFTPTKLPTLWTVEFFKLLTGHLTTDGIILTYTNSARVRNAMIEAGLSVGNIKTKDDNTIGTIASLNENLIKDRLTAKESGLLNTKAGIPYRDAALNLSAKDIKANLDSEIKLSNKLTSSQYLKGFKDEI